MKTPKELAQEVLDLRSRADQYDVDSYEWDDLMQASEDILLNDGDTLARAVLKLEEEREQHYRAHSEAVDLILKLTDEKTIMVSSLNKIAGYMGDDAQDEAEKALSKIGGK